MKRPIWQAKAEVLKVTDGDTFKARIDLGWKLSIEAYVRVEGINCPELPTREGQQALTAAQALLPPGAVVTLESKRLDKYGRSQANVVLPDGQDYATLMLNGGHAKPANASGELAQKNTESEEIPTLGIKSV
jgi:endonuclease YncB( thermonuclease family)